MAIRFSVNRFPRDPSIRDATGLPWGCTVQPFSFAGTNPISPSTPAPSSSAANEVLSGAPLTRADDVARCEDCFAYINSFCTIDRYSWRCSLCQVINTFSDLQLARYGSDARLASCAELADAIIDLDVATGEDADVAADGVSFADDVYSCPVYIAMVDLSGPEDFLELIKSTLLAALEALHPSARFGLLTFSHKIGLYDLRGSTAVVKHISIPSSGNEGMEVLLEDVMPLQAFLAPVAEHKENIAAALETLRHTPALPAIIPPGAPGEINNGTHEGNGGTGGGGAVARDESSVILNLGAEGAGGRRGFGAAVDALVKYMASDEGQERKGGRERGGGEWRGGGRSISSQTNGQAFVSARVLSFLSGIPNYGVGAMAQPLEVEGRRRVAGGIEVQKEEGEEEEVEDGEDRGEEQVEDEEEDQPISALTSGEEKKVAAFYQEVAAAAAEVGAAIDVFGIPSSSSRKKGVRNTNTCGLAALRQLAEDSGGGVFFYPLVEEATLPQDVYRMLQRPKAVGGVLRLRTSREFRAVRAFGHLFPDSRFEDLYHIISCDPFDSFVFDFEFSSSAGFTHMGRYSTGPLLQMAFQYTVIIPVNENGEERADVAEPSGAGANGDAGAGHVADGNGARGPRCMLRRRLRVRTIQVGVARSVREMYESTDNDAVLAVLIHKIIGASIEEGVKEGRLLLQDWLVILTAHYNDTFKLASFGLPSSVPRLDVSFVACPNLQPLPRLVFAMLRSSLLKFRREGVHPDLRVYLQSLFSCMDPSYLTRAVYPALSSYVSPDKLAFPRHSLSRAALITSGSPIFLLDAYTTIIVFYSPAAPASLPFPPPQNSLLRNTINRLKADRNITPRTIMIRGGVDKTDAFEKFLIEEQDVNGVLDSKGMGFVSFLESIAQDVREYLR